MLDESQALEIDLPAVVGEMSVAAGAELVSRLLLDTASVVGIGAGVMEEVRAITCICANKLS